MKAADATALYLMAYKRANVTSAPAVPKAGAAVSSVAPQSSYENAFAAYGYDVPSEVNEVRKSFGSDWNPDAKGTPYHFLNPDAVVGLKSIMAPLGREDWVPIMDLYDNQVVVASPATGKYSLVDISDDRNPEILSTASLKELLDKVGIQRRGKKA